MNYFVLHVNAHTRIMHVSMINYNFTSRKNPDTIHTTPEHICRIRVLKWFSFQKLTQVTLERNQTKQTVLLSNKLFKFQTRNK